MKKEFTFPVRVYYEDTDAGGVVYHANYLRFMERARTECLRTVGFDVARLTEQNIFFVVRRVEVNYLRPARLGDALVVMSRVMKASRAKLIFQQTVCVHHEEQPPSGRSSQGEPLCIGNITVVCVNSKMKLCRIPLQVVESIQ